MTDQRIGLTDEQKTILDAKLQRAMQARQEAERAAQEFNEAVRLVAGGEPAEYRQEEGVVVLAESPGGSGPEMEVVDGQAATEGS